MFHYHEKRNITILSNLDDKTPHLKVFTVSQSENRIGFGFSPKTSFMQPVMRSFKSIHILIDIM